MSNIEFKSFGEIRSCKDCLNNDVCKKQYDIEANPGLCTFYKKSADYRKERQGEWKYHECVSSFDGTISGYSCSVCNSFVEDDEFEAEEFHKKYCGNCGARMKGE